MDARAQRIIDLLGLAPHPEGGFYRETFRSDAILTLAPAAEQRSASTTIYFLLPAGVFSAFHVLHLADEIWHHYGGDPVEIHTIASEGDHRVELLGGDVAAGQRPQIIIPARTLQAAITGGPDFALCGCTVMPGFDFADFEMPTCEVLLRLFPRHENIIRRLTRT